jgi:hypothetical protein
MDLGRLIIMMLTLNVVLYVIGVSDNTFTIGTDTPMNDIYNISGGYTQLAGNTPFGQMSSQLNTTEINSGAQDYSISVWGMVKSSLFYVGGFFFGVSAMLVAIGAPWQITLIVSVIWGVLYLLAVMSLVWQPYD